MNTKLLDNKTYLGQLIMLLLFIGSSILIISILFQLVFGILLDINIEEVLINPQEHPTGINYLKTLQIASSIAVFIIPVVIFYYLRSGKFLYQTQLNRKVNFKLISILILLLISMSPIAGWLYETNQMLQLPDSMQTIQDWIIKREQETEQLLKTFLQMNNTTDFILNLIMIGILPAIGEELMFRGTLQPLFNKWFKNKHWAILLTAILFSAIHIQFLGFLPRFALGLLFGYLFIWSNNLWYPIIAHLLHNGLQVILVYLYQLKIIETDIDKIEHIPLTILLPSVIVFLFSSFLFYKNGKRLGEGI